ncbi:MAG: iron-sulfur cluster assembly scaffold protein [Parerythrobacter sp.]
MARPQTATLYTPRILALAVTLADFPMDEDAAFKGSARSDTCGSALELGFDMAKGGAIAMPGARVTACAIGQAAAAVFLGDICGRTGADIIRAEAQLSNWLADTGPAPEWRDIELLDTARAYPARHGAIRLPWRAARDALCNNEGVR